MEDFLIQKGVLMAGICNLENSKYWCSILTSRDITISRGCDYLAVRDSRCDSANHNSLLFSSSSDHLRTLLRRPTLFIDQSLLNEF